MNFIWSLCDFPFKLITIGQTYMTFKITTPNHLKDDHCPLVSIDYQAHLVDIKSIYKQEI